MARCSRIAARIVCIGLALASCIVTFAAGNCTGTVSVTETTIPSSISTCTAFYGDINLRNLVLGDAPVAAKKENAVTYDLGDIQTIYGSLTFSNISIPGWPDPGLQAFDTLCLNIKSKSYLTITDTLSIGKIRCGVNLNMHRPLAYIFYMEKVYMPQYALMASTLLQLIRNAAYITLIKTNIGDNLNVIAQNASYVKAVGNPVLNYLSITNSGLPAVVETKNNGNDFHLELNNITLASLALSEVSVLSAPALKRIGTFCLPDTFPISYFDPCWSIGTVFRNNSFSSLSLPSLDSIKTTVFYLLDNQYLSNLSLPVLQDVNGFNISSNPELRVVDLPKLDAIDWEFNVTGNLDSVSFPSLVNTNADVFISSNGTFDCNTLEKAQIHDDIFRGQFTCKNTANDSSAVSSSSNSEGRSLSGGVIAGLVVGILVALGLFATAAALVYLHRMRQNQGAERHPETHEKGELDGEEVVQVMPVELGTGELAEAPEKGMIMELSPMREFHELESPTLGRIHDRSWLELDSRSLQGSEAETQSNV